MHPAPSLILFTTFSGLGFGLLAVLGLGLNPATGLRAFILYGLGYGLAGGGLIASTFHLGHPERAWRALSQWRTSWLSREGVLSLATLACMAPHAASAVFLGQHLPVLGVIGGILSVLTVLATAMIYAQLKTVPRWHHWTTPAVFLSASFAGGMMLGGHLAIAGEALILLGLALIAHWYFGDRRLAETGHRPETATGLGRIGKVRLFERPHTGQNYLTREMVHVIGRKHAAKLRLFALAGASALPAIILLALPASYLLVALALVAHLTGMLTARWLFFAEAEHVVGLYYGRPA
jgi:DMSO reductase anchor subunit